MGWNGSGSWNRLYNWVADKAASINITASRMDGEFNDYANNGFGNCLTRDGQGFATANLPMGGFRHTGVQDGSARTDYGSLGQLEDGVINWVAAGGTADALTATYAPALTALKDGQLCFVRAAAANATTTPTFAPNGLTAETITLAGGAPLRPNDIMRASQELVLRYNLANTRWELLNPAFPVSGSLVHGQVQFRYASPTQVGLYPMGGNGIQIAAKLYALPAGGVVVSNNNATVGGVTGQTLAASTQYDVYAYIASGNSTIGLDFVTAGSGGTHTTSTTAGNVGVEIFNGGGGDSYTLVGKVATNASGQFQDAQAARCVISWFNRKRRDVYAQLTSGASTAAVSFTAWSGTLITFLCWAGEEVSLTGVMGVQTNLAPAFADTLVYVDAANAGQNEAITFLSAAAATQSNAIVYNGTSLAEGLHSAQLAGASGSTSYTVTWEAGGQTVISGTVG